MSKRITFTDDELATLQAALEYASRNLQGRLDAIAPPTATDRFALTLTKRNVDRLIAKVRPGVSVKPIANAA